MDRLKKALALVVTLSVVAVGGLIWLSGCGGSGLGTGGQGTLRVFLADSPDPTITSVEIDVSSVEAHLDGNWVTLTTSPKTYDLMELVHDAAVMAAVSVPPGTYTQVRFIVSECRVTDSEGTHIAKIPSGLQTGIKVNLNFTVDPGLITGILLDFNVERSLNKLGNGNYQLQPVIPATIITLSGTISGTVTNGVLPLSNAKVMAIYTAGPNYSIGTEVNASATLADGTFKIWALLPGTYRLDVSWTDPVTQITHTAAVNDVSVIAGEDTAVGTIVVP